VSSAYRRISTSIVFLPSRRSRYAEFRSTLPRRQRPRSSGVRALDAVKPENTDQRTGVEIVRKAIQAPAHAIVDTPAATAPWPWASCSKPPTTRMATTRRQKNFWRPLQEGDQRPGPGRSHGALGPASVAGLLITTEAERLNKPTRNFAAPVFNASDTTLADNLVLSNTQPIHQTNSVKTIGAACPANGSQRFRKHRELRIADGVWAGQRVLFATTNLALPARAHRRLNLAFLNLTVLTRER
jgi:hypothetical protein